MNLPIAIGRTNELTHDKELFQNRLEKPCQKQGAFPHQHRGLIRRHGRSHADQFMDMGRVIVQYLSS